MIISSWKDQGDMKTLAVCSGKGGAGKTVLSSALATMLTDLGHTVLLVDADYSVAGLTYLTGAADTGAADVGGPIGFTLKDLLLGTIDVSELKALAGTHDIVVLPSRTQTISDVDNDGLSLPTEQVVERYQQFLSAVRSLATFDYVITDTRAGLDKLSAAVALSSDRTVVLMEQDRVSWRSSHAFVANALALQDRLEPFAGRSRTAEDFYLLPNKVAPAYSRALRMMRGSVLGNVLPGIPLDLNFFNRYFRDISGYGPRGDSWRRTAFYRHLRNSMAEILEDVSSVRYSLASEILDSVSLVFVSWSPRVTMFFLGLIFYVLLTVTMFSYILVLG